MIHLSATIFSMYGISIYGYVNGYPNKIEFIMDLCNHWEDDKINYLKKRIKYNEGGRIGEVGWGLSLNPLSKRKSLRYMTQEEITGMRRYAFKHNMFKKFLYEVEMGDVSISEDVLPSEVIPHRLEGDILFSKPCGLAPHKIGDKNLAGRIGKLCTRYGFSDLDEYGWQFAQYVKYDDKLKLVPI